MFSIDMYDPSDTESLDDEADYCTDDDNYDFSEDTKDTHRPKNYSIFTEEDIRRLQADDIARVSTVLSVSKVAATILLRHYNWSVSKVEDAWFNDEERVRRTVGLLDNPVVQSSNAKKLTCTICFDSYRHDSVNAAACGHSYCSSCWTGYISTAINDGRGCLLLRCPDPSCGAAVGQDMIDRHASDEDKAKYSRFLHRSYIEDNKKKMKWCPAPDCECAIDFSAESGGVYDIFCLCSYSFCWNCTEEAHRPVDCDTVKKWILKNDAESANVNWIIANSKPCPKCQRPIEKNHGCMHMTCTPPCKFEFCWLCLHAWSDHGDYYSCNRYENAQKKGDYDEAERRRENAKKSLERYTHYYERWEANHLSRQKALVDLQQMQDVQLDRLSEIQSQPQAQLKFIIEAWLQIVECRRVLKWAYAYGYFIPNREHAKRQFFEYLQGEAESGLERLHRCAERELKTFLKAKSSPVDFYAFRSKLTVLTSVTGNYFENLVKALENGLEDVNAQKGCSKTKSGDGFAKKEKRKKGTKIAEALR